jgi:hypothetical protein
MQWPDHYSHFPFLCKQLEAPTETPEKSGNGPWKTLLNCTKKKRPSIKHYRSKLIASRRPNGEITGEKQNRRKTTNPRSPKPPFQRKTLGPHCCKTTTKKKIELFRLRHGQPFQQRRIKASYTKSTLSSRKTHGRNPKLEPVQLFSRLCLRQI